MRTRGALEDKGEVFYQIEFRSQEPEFRMNFVRLVDELRFKAPGFIRGEKREFSFVETPDFRHEVF